MRRPGRLRRLVGTAAVLAVAASCTSGGGTPAADGDQQPAALVDRVTDRLAGLGGEDRRRALAELAVDERADLTLSTSLSVDLAGPVVEAFTDAYGIEVDLYRAPSDTVLARVRDEAEAGFAGTDVVLLNGSEMAELEGAGLLQPLVTPATAGLAAGTVHETWAAVYHNLFVVAWNSDRVASPPATWREVLSGHTGRIAFELSDFDWFATIVDHHLVGELGMSEDEAVDLFRRAAEGARLVDGHSLLSGVLGAGEVDVAMSAYLHNVERGQADGAPVAWEPAVEPVVAQPNGIGVSSLTDAPAGALLLVEFMLTDAQAMLAEAGRVPATEDVAGAVPDGYDVVTTDVAALEQERAKWQDLYAGVLTQGDD